MRRIVLAVSALLLVSGGLLAADAPKKRSFSLNAGAQMMIWSDVEAATITLDFRASFRLGPSFELSPEIAFWTGGDTGHSTSDKSRLSPGLMANFVIGRFFLGGGVILPDGFGAKANIGYVFGHIMVTAHFGTAMLSDEQNTVFGLNLGYRF